jgi:hypothetical protein
VRPRSDGPMMNKTKLGWIIHGLVATSRKEDLGIVKICCEEADNTLHETVKQFMAIENFGVKVSKIARRKSEKERLAQKMMEKTIEFIGDRYSVGLPYVEAVKFPESYKNAIYRLKCTERRLEKTDEKQWRMTQHWTNDFWKRWLREYLPTLQKRGKWKKKSENVAVEDTV